MPRFLFQSYPIHCYEFYPIPIGIDLGIKIPTEEIINDYEVNNTESMICGTDRIELLNRIQTTFVREFERWKVKEPDIRPTNYKTMQA
ncbi:MAG: hypothetical protein L0H53_02925 [Candidatus Nitrosocosmicus sp.]|nr:hypothetical protein [Candidatus Nitrosocosmicus sp.]MDN5866385.1 hypothetical protein [Candidatus Nitrosocosmicus sp.]